MIVVVNKKTHKPCQYDVYIGRPSPLGNPYKVVNESKRSWCVQEYSRWFHNYADVLNSNVHREIRRLIDMHKAGKTIHLMCWCAPLACHGDVLKKYIEEAAEAELGMPF